MPSPYVTIAGDTPDIIAHKLWGDEMLMHKLVEANPELRAAIVLDAGIVLAVPDAIPETAEAAPPWRQT